MHIAVVLCVIMNIITVSKLKLLYLDANNSSFTSEWTLIIVRMAVRNNLIAGTLRLT